MTPIDDHEASADNVYWLNDRRPPAPTRTSRTPRYLPSRFVDVDSASTAAGMRVLEPVMAWAKGPKGPPLWSDEATWLSVADVAVDLPHVSLNSGWPHDWLFDTLYGDKVETATVAQVSPIDILAADPIKRPLWYPGKKSRAGIHRVGSTERHHSHDSMFERNALTLLDWGDAEQILSQPGTLRYQLGGHFIAHTPDFAADIDGTFTLINCRPRPLLNERLINNCSALAEVCLMRGWRSVVIVGYRLPAISTLTTVRAKSNAHDWLGYRSQILALLSSGADEPGPAMSFEAICSEFEYPMEARSMLQRLIWDRSVAIDLNEMLTDDSIVRLSTRTQA